MRNSYIFIQENDFENVVYEMIKFALRINSLPNLGW